MCHYLQLDPAACQLLTCIAADMLLALLKINRDQSECSLFVFERCSPAWSSWNQVLMHKFLSAGRHNPRMAGDLPKLQSDPGEGPAEPGRLPRDQAHGIPPLLLPVR